MGMEISSGAMKPQSQWNSSSENDISKLKDTLKSSPENNENVPQGEKYAALDKLRTLLGEKVNGNTATEDEKTEHGLLTKLHNNSISDEEINNLASRLGMDDPRVLRWSQQDGDIDAKKI